VVFLVLGGIMIILATRSITDVERGWVQRVLVFALVGRVAIAAVFELLPQLRIFHEYDADGYELFGVRMALAWQGRYPPFEMSSSNPGYYYVCGALCYLFGPFRFNIPLFNTVVGTLTVALIYRFTRDYFHVLVARRAAVLVAFTPSMMLWSAMALKDTLVTFLIIVALWACVRLKEAITVGSLSAIVLSVAAIQTLRFYMIYFVAFAIMVALVFDRGVRVVTGFYKQVFLGAIAVALFSVVGLSGRAVEGTEYLSFEKASIYRRGMASTANSGFSADADVSTPGRALAFLPIGLANLLLAPFPWQMTSLRPLIAAPETVAWWILFPPTISGVALVVRRRFREMSPLLIFSVSLACAYSLVHGNVGSAFRQRAQIFVFLFIFSSLGWYRSKCRRAGIDDSLLLNGARGGEDGASHTIRGTATASQSL